MDKINHLEEAILTVLNAYAKKWQNPEPSPYHLVVDSVQKRYVLFEMGFEGRIFYHFPVFHLSIEKEQIWVFEDKSEEGIVDLLMELSISAKDIVLGYYSEAYRKITDLTAA
jgi:hypothetical protein